jgi:heme/copper-type cytochrome/quinol oxidase subunit 2
MRGLFPPFPLYDCLAWEKENSTSTFSVDLYFWGGGEMTVNIIIIIIIIIIIRRRRRRRRKTTTPEHNTIKEKMGWTCSCVREISIAYRITNYIQIFYPVFRQG